MWAITGQTVTKSGQSHGRMWATTGRTGNKSRQSHGGMWAITGQTVTKSGQSHVGMWVVTQYQPARHFVAMSVDMPVFQSFFSTVFFTA